MSKISREDINYQTKILVLIVLLLPSIVLLYINKSQCYYKYERIEFESSGANLYANLYYPSKDLTFQEKKPLIIYCHGIGNHRDFDLRVPIEFTKRGFYIVALDYQGQGESGGNIINLNQVTNMPALAQDCSNLLDKLKTLPFYSDVDTSQIGLIGHSLGGMVVLMNQALDHRFAATVAWAPLVNFDPHQLGIVQTSKYDKYIPVHLLNKENTHNLLIIMHVNDEMLDFRSQALVAQALTGCTVIPITEPLIGGGHALFSDKVLIESIKWFEEIFFKSKTINGPIQISFLFNYILLFINLAILFGIVLLLISYSSYFFEFNKHNNDAIGFEKNNLITKSIKIKQIIKVIFYSILFVLNWIIFERIFGFLGIFISSVNVIEVYTIIAIIIYFKRLKKEKFRFNLKEFVKSRIHLKYLISFVIFTFYFVAIYFIFSSSYQYYTVVLTSKYLDFILLIIGLSSIILTAFTSIYAIFVIRIHFKKIKEVDKKFNLKEYVRSHNQFKIFLFSVVSILYFIAVYLIFSISYPFAFVWPSNITNYILTATVFPVYLSIEILYRKIIYPCLFFLTEDSKTIVIIIFALFVQLNLIALTWAWLFFPSVILSYFIFLVVILLNTMVYQHTKSFNSVVLSSFVLIQVFFSAVLSNAFGIGTALDLFVNLHKG